MVTCPWCGTNYLTFQSNCQNCGGPLSLNAEGDSTSLSGAELPIPPAPPRPISNRYAWRILSSDGLSVASFVFLLLGATFSLVGLGLILGGITAFVGIPFLLSGFVFLGIGAVLLGSRYQKAQKVVNVLREGDSTVGQVTDLRENTSVSVNGRSPWIITYQFQFNGQTFTSKVSTLNQPGPQLQVGKAVRILYLAADAHWSSIFPHP